MKLPHFIPISKQKFYNDEPIYACDICKKSNIKNISKIYHNKLHLCDKHLSQLERKEKLKMINGLSKA